MHIQKGPTVWHGLPDLRDLAHDNNLWGRLPIAIPTVSELLQLTKPQIYMMVKCDLVEHDMFFDRIHILLKSLPQTARCRYIELIFRPRSLSNNILHKSVTVCKALGLNRKALSYYCQQGHCAREFLPNKTIRYPEWGFDDNQRRAIKKYYASLNNPDELEHTEE